MAQLGPFGPSPRLAVAVSGGADSTALALLSQHWATAQNGSVIAFIVDHGLRPASASEASLTKQRLASRNIPAQIITLSGLPTGARLQEAARNARYEALTKAAIAENCLFLLLGHHAADQSETIIMRQKHVTETGAGGLEGIAAWTARSDILLLRPLLHTSPAALREFLIAESMDWAEDPSNQNPKFERIRIRQSGVLAQAAPPQARNEREQQAAAFLAGHVTIRPEGFAIIHAAAMPPASLAALLRIIAGANYPPSQAQIAALAQNLRPATLGGARIALAKKLGGSWLVAREAAACAPPVTAQAGVVWDHRFTLQTTAKDQQLSALGADAANFRKVSPLPSLVLRGLPCLRRNGVVTSFPAPCLFTPPAPATTYPFTAIAA